MGCNCGGARARERQQARLQEAATRQELTGPKAPGYTWDGPKRPEAKPEPKPAQ